MMGDGNLPKDPYILLSFVNTKLRDEYKTLELFCEDYGADEKELVNALKSVGYIYNQKNNQFIST